MEGMTADLVWENDMREKVQADIDGRVYQAAYEIKGGLVIVYWNMLDKAAQLGGHASNTDVLARRLLRELVRDHPELD